MRVLVVSGSVAAGVLAMVILSSPASPKALRVTAMDLRSAEARSANLARREVDRLYTRREFDAAIQGYRSFIGEHKASPDLDVQDEVGIARIRLGYCLTKNTDWLSARETFLEAERDYRGTGRISADFGGIPDQAAYQAAVCLEASGELESAKRGYREFLKKHELSPLVHAVFKRLVRLNRDQAYSADEKLLQDAISAQERFARFESTVCGPKAIAYLLRLLELPPRDYKDIAKLCGTNGQGTTLEGMKGGLEACGIRSTGLLLNRADFSNLTVPAIWLYGEHYLVLTKIGIDRAIAYNPVFKSEREVPLPSLDDKQFAATVLKISASLTGEKPR